MKTLPDKLDQLGSVKPLLTQDISNIFHGLYTTKKTSSSHTYNTYAACNDALKKIIQTLDMKQHHGTEF